MSRYVISDLHGNYTKFLELLTTISFSEKDELYIIGDLFDRGKNPIKLYEYIKQHKNIILLKGNHEQLFQETFETGDYRFWELFGGNTTINEIRKKPQMYEYDLYKEIRQLPIIKIVDNFVLVHAGLYFPNNYKDLSFDDFIKEQDIETCLWSRDLNENNLLSHNFTIIYGHTPVQTINESAEEAKIIKKEGIFYIDCGLETCKSNGRLGCLCLDTLEEFYI